MTDTHTREVMARYQRFIFPAAAPLYGDDPLIVSHAQDQYLWDTAGQRYLDFFGGVLTVSAGHCNAEITAHTIQQLQRVQHTTTLLVNEVMIDVAEKVAALAPGHLQKCYFTNSGSEANETAILAARMYTGNQDIITLRHAYSGRTTQTMSLTAHGTWRLGNTFDPHIRHVRNPYIYRSPLNLAPDELVDLCVQDLEETIATTTNGRIAAFMAEPIQGVGGFIVPPSDYFRRIEPIVRAAGGVFISDEVQTGWGRTGEHWFGIQHAGIDPDIMTFAKGMANGSPIGCTIATPAVADALRGSTFATFGGNPVTMATALATINYLEKINAPLNAAQQGALLRMRLDSLKDEFDCIGDVRGMGLMQAIEFIVPDTDKHPDAARTTDFITIARKNGLLIGRGGLYNNVVRIAPHLNVSETDITVGCDILAQTMSQIAG